MAAARVALIGYGLAGEFFHAPLITTTPGLQLAAVVTRDPERRHRCERAHPQAALFESAHEVWQRRAELDVVVIASPNRTHVPLALQAVQVGLPVVVDKPLAATAADAQTLIDAAEERGVMLTVFHNRRWDGDFLTAQRLLREDVLGRPLRFESRYERWRPVAKGGWRELDEPAEAGGVLYDLGSHLIDQSLLLFGPVDHVYAEIGCHRPGMHVDDDVFLALAHASGVHSHLHVSWITAQPGPRMRLLGSRAAYVKYGMDVQEAALRSGARPDAPEWGRESHEHWGLLGAGEDVRPVATEAGAYPRFYKQLADALQGMLPPVNPRDALAGLQIIEAARRSALEQRSIRLETC
jgi:predicted dehydrogenase